MVSALCASGDIHLREADGPLLWVKVVFPSRSDLDKLKSDNTAEPLKATRTFDACKPPCRIETL